jgi:hypothetical protein
MIDEIIAPARLLLEKDGSQRNIGAGYRAPGARDI